MPAKPLTPEQKEDTARLKAAFRAWQDAQRDAGSPISQIEAAHRLGFGQSALSQYLNGAIPLNGPVLKKFTELIGVKAEEISPTVSIQEAERARIWSPTESALEQLAVDFFEQFGVTAAKTTRADRELLPDWFEELLPGYTPDLRIDFENGEHAWVEVRSPHSTSPRAEKYAVAQATHGRDFLLLMADTPDIPRVIELWLRRRDHPEAALTPPEPDRFGMVNQRPMWVVGRTQGGMPERIWDDSDSPTGATDEFADISTSDDRAFACRVVGDSMVPRYMPGEYALVEPGTLPELEDDVLVRLVTGETMLKRLLSRRSGIRLGSYNSPEVMTFREDEISWLYYVAHPIPPRRIKQRIDIRARDIPDRRSQEALIEIERRKSARRLGGEQDEAAAPATSNKRKVNT